MSKITCILFDPIEVRVQLYPLTLTRAISDIRLGIRTLKEQWEDYLADTCFVVTESYLQPKYVALQQSDLYLFINSSFVPDTNLCEAIKQLEPESELVYKNEWVAKLSISNSFSQNITEKFISYTQDVVRIQRPWDIFSKNDEILKREFNRLNSFGNQSQIPEGVTLIGSKENVYIDSSAIVMPSVVLNAQKGPIYIGKDCEVMEGTVIRGPFAMIDHAATKIGTKIYGATTLDPHVKVGGEINNSVIFGYSNKGHDGFLGNSVIGEWCNLGADTNNSNLKNNYSEVKLYSYFEKKEIGTGLQFCGLIMGDHSKSGINTMFNTGTVVGVCTNIYGSDFPPKHIPSFSWGTAHKLEEFLFDKAIEVAVRMMERRSIQLSTEEQAILLHIYQSRN